MDVHFSIGGKIYSGEPIVYRPLEDRIFENSRNISVKLHHRVGKFVKLRLHFSARWILISEISFRSGPLSLIGRFPFNCRLLICINNHLKNSVPKFDFGI
jgi:hypothetical protein